MLKMIVIYGEPKEKERFEEYYFLKHLPLIKQLPYLVDYNIQRVTNTMNTDKPAYLITELKYTSEEEFNLSYTSAEGRIAQKDTEDMMPYLDEPPVVYIVRAFEVR